MIPERQFEVKHFLWLCAVCLPLILLASCKWPQAYHHYDHYGIAYGATMRGPNYHKGRVTWGSGITQQEIDEVNRMRARLACQKP